MPQYTAFSVGCSSGLRCVRADLGCAACLLLALLVSDDAHFRAAAPGVPRTARLVGQVAGFPARTAGVSPDAGSVSRNTLPAPTSESTSSVPCSISARR